MSTSRYIPTIYDVAKRVGVSANTVSRALNGKPGVSSATRARVLAVAEEMEYHPHLGARSLRVKHEGCIGVTVPAPMDVVPLSRGFFMYLCDELYRILGARGERICLDLNPYANGADSDYARSVWQKLYGACLVAGPLRVDDTTIHRLHRSGVPYMALGRLDSLPECSFATVDYDRGVYECVKLLLAKGHTRIGMLKALTDYQPGVERRRGYLRALEEAGIAPEERLMQAVSFSTANVANATYRLLSDHSVTAIVDASGMEDAAAIRHGARRACRKPGADFDIVCWTYSTDVPVLEEATAHLWLPVREAASEGLELLAAWFWGKREGPIQVLYPPTMLETSAMAAKTQGHYTTPDRLFDSSIGTDS